MDRQYVFGLHMRLAKTIESVLEIRVYLFSLCFLLGLSLHPSISFLSLLLQSSLSMTMISGFLSFVSVKTKTIRLYITEGKTKHIFVIAISLESKISANASKF